MKVLIIEDEINNSKWLKKQLEDTEAQIEVSATLETVEESIKYLENDNSADLIFMDVKLSDGLCFEIFEQVKISIPVIFVTAYDEYIISALQYNCLDYLLKPIQPDKLRNAIQKYRQMETYFLNRNFKAFFDQIKTGVPKKNCG